MNLSCAFYDLHYHNTDSYHANSNSCAATGLALSLPTTLLNAPLLIVFLTIKDRAKPPHMLLANLVFTDTLCGLIGLPSLFFLFYKLGIAEDPCSISIVLIPITYILGLASFLNICAIALERYLAIFHPFFYRTKATVSTVAVAIAVIWLLAFLSLAEAIFLQTGVGLRWVLLSLGTLGIVLTCCMYLRIYILTRKVRKQISDTEQRFGNQTVNRTETNLVLTGSLMLVSVFICFFPILIVNVFNLLGYRPTESGYAICWAWILSTSNSLLNGIITCSQLSYVRKAMLKLCRFPSQEEDEERSTR